MRPPGVCRAPQSVWLSPIVEFGVYVINNDSLPSPHMIGRAKALKETSTELRGRLRYAVYDDAIRRQLFREKHLEKSMRPEYYSHIVSARKYTDDKVLQFPEGIKMLISYTSFAYNEDGKKYDVESYTDDCLSYLGNDRLKGEYVVNNSFRSFKSYDQYLNAMEKFGKYLVTPSLKMRAEAVGTKLYDTKAGGQAADFTYPDVDGKMVSLSDFKGKVVLVDVWATWCGPCRQQIPYLKKLEEEMHGTDVVFGGVSVDESKDKQKWLDFIKTEGLKGVQLLAGGWSKITKDYKITGIPRFMVFDKKGNIVSVDAPRPSSPELKKMLENELKK